jgi:hypothetical protein
MPERSSRQQDLRPAPGADPAVADHDGLVARWLNPRTVGVAAIIAGLLASAGLVWHESYSAFSATTSNSGNSWTGGTVQLSDDDSGGALFNASGLAPGSTGSQCISVTSTGTLPALIKLYGTSYATTRSLAAALNLTVTQGTGAGYGSCTGFTPLTAGATVFSGTLAGFATAHSTYGSGILAGGAGAWKTTGATSSRTYRFTYTMSPAAPTSTMGGTAAVGFTWESQNT